MRVDYGFGPLDVGIWNIRQRLTERKVNGERQEKRRLSKEMKYQKGEDATTLLVNMSSYTEAEDQAELGDSVGRCHGEMRDAERHGTASNQGYLGRDKAKRGRMKGKEKKQEKRSNK